MSIVSNELFAKTKRSPLGLTCKNHAKVFIIGEFKLFIDIVFLFVGQVFPYLSFIYTSRGMMASHHVTIAS